jgi:hypothetical protein
VQPSPDTGVVSGNFSGDIWATQNIARVSRRLAADEG